MPYQPDRDPLERYLRRQDLQQLVARLGPRTLGRANFYNWLALLEEPAAPLYSNFVAAQFVWFAICLNSCGSTALAVRQLRAVLDAFESEQEFTQEVFREAEKHCQPRWIRVFDSASDPGDTVDVRVCGPSAGGLCQP